MLDPNAIAKAELHLHIEGTLEPELLFTLAERNGVTPKYPDIASLRKAYDFTDLQSFLDVYYEGMRVLQTSEDFRDLTMAYMERATAQGVRHVEMFFDPQAHTNRGLRFETVLEGIDDGLRQAQTRFGTTSHLIMCFLRDLSAQAAMNTLETALPYRERIVAVGLDSAERGNPPSKFQTVFDRARAEGFLTVAHAGEEGPPEYVWEALDLLRVSRVDHGIRSLEDPQLVERLRRQRIPLTVCPLSNVRLRVVPDLAHHPLKRMLDMGLVATVNSDDPAYFGGYVGQNFSASAAALHLSDDDLLTLARNSFEASFLDDASKRGFLDDIDRLVHGAPA